MREKPDLRLHSELCPLRTEHSDLSGHIALSHLFLLMQEVAGNACETIGYGREFAARENVFWVLSRVSVQLFQPIKRNSVVKITTWPDVNMRYLCPRFFQAHDIEGRALMEVSTVWVLVDQEARGLYFPSQHGFTMPSAPQGLPKMELPGRIAPPCELDHEVVRAPLYSDFDVNGHMNNARYPLWICDLFPPERFMHEYINSFQINYVKEVVSGESVSMRYGEKDGRFAVRGEVSGEVRFEAMGGFAKIDDQT